MTERGAGFSGDRMRRPAVEGGGYRIDFPADVWTALVAASEVERLPKWQIVLKAVRRYLGLELR